ncbi:MAG: glutamate synthase domain-containing protein 2 [Myxococcota bacterium]|jgi:glutamate synthase domain-containing protein 2
MARRIFYVTSTVIIVGTAAIAMLWLPILWTLILTAPVIALGFWDVNQKRRTILRNFPVIGHGRYLLEMIRPEIMQYFIEDNQEGRPVNREQRSIVYQRAKRSLASLPFGTQLNVYDEGYEWIAHSMVPTTPPHEQPRIRIGSPDCSRPYDASVLNISAMSFGSLSYAAIRALNGGAKLGAFYHNTGEGGVSDHHQAPGGDICWQIGTGYFGCRAADGGFDPDLFKETCAIEQIRLIEIKVSQGAKPGHGGILPASKITPEIARIRNVPLGQDVISPPSHRTFSTPIGLLEWVGQLRQLSGGRPVGFKLCIGKRREFLAICKAMLATGITPDFISVDGGEGGTGAAPLEFSNRLGSPLTEGLVFVHNALVGFGLRDHVKVIASGKVFSAFDIVKRLAIGADLVCSARAMMFAVGCIQALRCNSNDCPTGVATQDPDLISGLDIDDKTKRVHAYHEETVKALMHILGAAGLTHPNQLRPWHIHRRISPFEVRHYGEIYEYIEHGALLNPKDLPASYARATLAAQAESFGHSGIGI